MTITVTATDLENAETEAEAARQALREVEQAYGRSAVSTGGYEARRAAAERADHAETRFKVLSDDFAAQQAVRDQRAAAGEAAAVELTGDIKGLGVSRKAAVSAVLAAGKAMQAALDALEKHDEDVRAVGRQLAGLGLRCADGEATGAALDGSVFVRGELHPLVDGASVLGVVLAEMVAVRQPRHPLARTAWRPYGGVSAGKGRDEVLAEVRGSKAGRGGR